MNESATMEISELEVLNYLRKNTGLLLQHPELLAHMDLDHKLEGTVSLVERQVKSLREQNRKLQGQLIDLLKAAQDNEALFTHCTELFERWLGDPNPTEIIASISDDIRELFGVDAVRLVLNTSSAPQQASDICSQLQISFPDNQPLCGPCDLTTSNWLFTSGEEYKSMTIIPIGDQAESGLLILGSEDANGFKATMGTLFLDQIGRVLSSLLTSRLE